MCVSWFCFCLSPGLLLLLLYNCRWDVSPSPRLLDVSVKSLINFHMSSWRFVNTRVLTLVREMELQLDCELWFDANLVLKRFIIVHQVNYLDNVAFCWEIKYQDNSAEVWGSDEGSCDKSVFPSLAGNIWFSDSPRPAGWRMCYEVRTEKQHCIVQPRNKTHIKYTEMILTDHGEVLVTLLGVEGSCGLSNLTPGEWSSIKLWR